MGVGFTSSMAGVGVLFLRFSKEDWAVDRGLRCVLPAACAVGASLPPALPAARRQDAGRRGVRGVGVAVPRLHPARDVRHHIPALRRQLSEVSLRLGKVLSSMGF